MLILTAIQEYWAKMDQEQKYPHNFHAAMAKAGWIGIALPEDHGGGGLGVAEATILLHSISEYDSVELMHVEAHSDVEVELESQVHKAFMLTFMPLRYVKPYGCTSLLYLRPTLACFQVRL